MSISQPPPTPGIFQWVLGSLFNKETPSHKYQEKAEKFEYKPYEYKPYKSNKPNGYKYDYNKTPSESIRRRNYYKERELLYDDDTFHRRSHSMGNLNEKLHLNHPGKFPSPYVSKESNKDFTKEIPSSPPILSSTSKNFRLANINTERNKSITINSSPIIIPDNKDELEILEILDLNNKNLNQINQDFKKYKNQNNNENHDYNELKLKYNDIKMELMSELQKTQALYDSYYKYVNKYKKLKENSNVDKIKKLENKLITQEKLFSLELYKRDEKIKELEQKLLDQNSTTPLTDDTFELFNRKYPDRK